MSGVFAGDPAERPAGEIDELASLRQGLRDLEQENQRLRERALALELDRHKSSTAGSLDAGTGFRNGQALTNYLSEVMSLLSDVGGQMTLLIYELAPAAPGPGKAPAEEDAVRAAAFLRSELPESALAFRPGERRLAFVFPNAEPSTVAPRAARTLSGLEGSSPGARPILMNAVAESIDAWAANVGDHSSAAESMLEECYRRLRSLGEEGGGRIEILSEAEAAAVSELPLVMVVEPDAFNATVVVDLLKRHGYDCLWFQDGSSAYDRMLLQRPGLVISEYAVPRLGGLDLRRRMRAEGRLRALERIPFVLLSEIKNDASIREAAGLGIDWYLQKPYFTAELLQVVASALARTGAIEALCKG